MRRFFLQQGLTILSLLLLWAPGLWAAFGQDSEAPVPEFARQDADVVATLIPRGKSTKVAIQFHAAPGQLEEVSGMDFAAAARPEVSVRDFRSALFTVAVDKLPRGGETRIAIKSRYFNSSTRYWVFNAARVPAWTDATTENRALADQVNELVVVVQDGGPLDSDNAVNGAVMLVGGPLDSFWGYAIGTLFIRFFGIFLVLGILMLGMLASGRIYRFFEARQARRAKVPDTFPAVPEVAAPAADGGVSPAMAAAVALALHLHRGAHRPATAVTAGPENGGPSVWASQGRTQIMNGRLGVFVRAPRAWKA
jgi:hypothetical protein